MTAYQSVGAACDYHSMTHPGDDWPRMTPWSPRDMPWLVLDGRRSIHCGWPPKAACETCKENVESGYAGPTADDLITYPNSSIRYVCTGCARSQVGLEPGELSGHSCGEGCTDQIHTDAFYKPRGNHNGMGVDELGALYAPEYAGRGWRVLAVVPATWLPVTVGGDRWAVQFVPLRTLW